MVHILLMNALVLMSGFVMAQKRTEVSVEVLPKWVLIGMPAEMQIVVKTSPGNQIEFPLFETQLTQDIEVLDPASIDTSASEGMEVFTRKVQITGWDSGMFMIPPLTFIQTSIDGKKDSLFSRPAFLEVTTVALDSSDEYRDIKSPEEVPYIFAEFKELVFLGLGIAVLLGVLFFFLIRWLNRKKQEPDPKPKQPIIPAHVIALKELEQLRSEGLWQKGNYKGYHSRLTEIVRGYIERRMQINALEMTTAEVIASMRRAGLDRKAPVDELEQILRLADLVKFAKEKPLADENERAFALALQFVEETKPTRSAETKEEGA